MKRIFFILLLLSSFHKLNAQGWIQVGTGSHALNANNTIGAICTDTGSIIYAAGGFTDSLSDTSGLSYVAKWNGTSWSQLGTLHAYGIWSLCVDASHNLYAAVPLGDTGLEGNVFKWDGVTWSELGTGANALNTNASINSICVDRIGNVYAAGQFTDSLSNTIGHEYVAKWDGTTWNELGTGTNALNADDWIMSIVSDSDDNIYAAGSFRYYPGGYSYVAKWDGANWSELGIGSNALNANGSIWTLNIDIMGNIYAAGFFPNADGNPYVAMWNGGTWRELGTGSNALNANYAILSISSDTHGNVYAGGDFTDVSGKGYVTKWNGTTWAEIGMGVNALNANGPIYTICLDDTGYIYAAGDFNDSIAGYGHRYVAKYYYSDEGITPVYYNSVLVYPNPTNAMVDIIINSDLVGTTYVLIDASGKIIRYGNLGAINNLLDMSELACGVYFLQMKNKLSQTFKIIKQ